MTPRKSKRTTARARSVELIWLDQDAAVGAYHVDAAVLEAAASISSECEQAELVRRARRGVNHAACIAVLEAEALLVKFPPRERALKRLFKDLDRIRLLIERNKRIDAPSMMEDKARQLRAVRAALNQASEAIDKLLSSHVPLTIGGNHDPLTHAFLGSMFDCWGHCFVGEGSPDEARLFVRLCAAAWRDVRFPTRDQDGRVLDDWLYDRIRKHPQLRTFPEGVTELRRWVEREGLREAFDELYG
jgi:hypothetical protein